MSAELGTIQASGTQYHVARAGAAQVREIVTLLADDPLGRSRESDPDDEVYLRAFRTIDADPNQALLVVLDQDGRVVATAQLSLIPNLSHRGGLRAQVEGVRVAAHLRGRGLGAAFMGWIVDHSRGRGAVMLQLTTSNQRTGAVPFYERLGFGLTHHGMKLSLGQPE